MKIEIRDTDVKVKSGTSARTGKDYSIREQEAWAHLDDKPYPSRVVVTVDDDAPPYEPGYYDVAPQSFFVGRFDQMMFRLRLERATRTDLESAKYRKASGQ